MSSKRARPSTNAPLPKTAPSMTLRLNRYCQVAYISVTCSNRSSISNHLSIYPSALHFPKYEEMSQEQHISRLHLHSPRQSCRSKDLQVCCAHLIGEQYVADERGRFVRSGLGDGVTDAYQAFCVIAGLILLKVYELDIGIGTRDF